MNFTIRMLAPVFHRENERPADFAERVRRIMAEELKKLDIGTIWESLASERKRSTE